MDVPSNAGQNANSGQMAGTAQPADSWQPGNAAQFISGIPSDKIRMLMMAAMLLLGFAFVFLAPVLLKSGADGLLPFIIFLPVVAIFIFYAYQYTKSKQLQLKIDKPAYSPGEEITGSVILNLEKEKQARSLKARFFGMQGRGKHSRMVCKTEAILSGAHIYRKGESYKFSIVFPSGAMQYIPRAGEYMRTTLWYVAVQLDIPGEIDMVQQVEVKLQAAPGAQPPAQAETTA